VIKRELPNGELILIPQTEHSRLAGKFAAHWGNSVFSPLSPYDSVVRATIYHDFSWLSYEASPLVNEQTGHTYGFGETPPDPRRLVDQQWCIDWLNSLDPYSAVLVSKHRTGLIQGRYGTINHPTSYNPGTLTPAAKEFVARNEAWQKEALAAMPNEVSETLATNYRFLQVWDLLALYFSCQEPYGEYIDPVPTSYADTAGTKMTLTPESPTRVAIDPYPFDLRPLTVQLGCQRMDRSTFEGLADFRREYFQATREFLTFELV
jgi:hypothetical protein